MKRIAIVGALVLVLSACSWIGRADVDSNGVAHQNTGADGNLAVSADGRYVAFVTNGPLDPADDDNSPSLYRRDEQTGTTERLTTTDPEVGQGLLENVAMSSDGNRIAFSTLDGMTADDTNENYDVYVVDVTAGTLERVSVDDNGDDLPDVAGFPRFLMSGDGNVVVLQVEQNSNDRPVFVRDLAAGTTVPLDDATGRELSDVTDDGSTVISATDGFLTFYYVADNSSAEVECTTGGGAITGDGATVVADFFGDPGCPDGIARYDVASGDFTDADVGHGVVETGGVSGDGEYFVFTPTDPFAPHGLKPGHVYVHGMTAGLNQLLDGDAWGQPVTGGAVLPVISDDASTTAFEVSAGYPGLTPPGPAVLVRPGLRPVAWAVSAASAARGAQHVQRVVIGQGLVNSTVELGPGITVHSTTPAPQGYLTVDFSVAPDAPTGPHDVVVLNHSPGGNAAVVCFGCLSVT